MMNGVLLATDAKSGEGVGGRAILLAPCQGLTRGLEMHVPKYLGQHLRRGEPRRSLQPTDQLLAGRGREGLQGGDRLLAEFTKKTRVDPIRDRRSSAGLGSEVRAGGGPPSALRAAFLARGATEATVAILHQAFLITGLVVGRTQETFPTASG